MKKLFLLVMLLGLAGCGDNNQSDTTLINTQVSTSQTTQEAVPTTTNYRLAASPQTMGAIAPLAGWTVTNSTTVGASKIIEASRGSTVSAALITPNAKQVANVLKGGLAGIALSVAVDQLLGAIDWVMDPANNSIRYKVKPNSINDPTFEYIYTWVTTEYFTSPEFAAKAICAHFKCRSLTNIKPLPLDPYILSVSFVMSDGRNGSVTINKRKNSAFNPEVEQKEKILSLDVIAAQVISNADSGSLDAQVATNIAAQNILNDVEQAEPVVRNLEDNARDKDPRCKAYLTEMNEWVAELESRYAKMLEDEHNLYRDYRSLRQGHPVYGSWQGHKDRYNAIRTKLRSVIIKAVLDGCSVPQYIRDWAERKPPEQPLPKG
ncbi:hypothetical protein KTJ32_17815 [Acinetobacter gyllenbergii]|uniref:hypothetical protein n=1 Tax=Acinetobacter gyllenbergii TaxID=134534 RepID=UPI0021D219B7|nr:hypothetical protein [Acinetobacter gyllenbergii]MCU4582855.1 hypothetical protein [Acinetobacter gyllenbergii]